MKTVKRQLATLISIILVALVIVGIVWSFDLENYELSNFTDKELGISFDYPASWGEVFTKTKANNWNLTKKISFTSQPNLYFEASSSAQRSDAENLRTVSDSVVSSDNDLSKYCKENITNDRSEPLSDEIDMYRLNSLDEFGICPDDGGNIFATVHRTYKSVDENTEKQEIVPKKDLDRTSGSTTLHFSKRYYLKLKNPLYGSLIAYQSGISDGKSQNYCFSPWNAGTDPTNKLKTYNCLSYHDKPLIDKAFKKFSRSKFNKETEHILEKMRIIEVEDYSQAFVSNFAELNVYKNEKYSYSYPKIFSIHPSEDNQAFNAVKLVTRESTIENKNFCDKEPYFPCFGLYPTVWDDEKKLLDSNPPDGSCALRVSDLSLCEIKTYGENKFLIRYSGRFTGEHIVEKKYIIYKGGDRYEITPPELYDMSKNPVLFKAVENQLIQKIYEDIVESLIFL